MKKLAVSILMVAFVAVIPVSYAYSQECAKKEQKCDKKDDKKCCKKDEKAACCKKDSTAKAEQKPAK